MGHTSKLTDLEGKANAEFGGADNSTIAAVYLGNDAYLPSNSTASYVYPMAYSSPDISACFPLVLIVGFLLVVFSALSLRNRFR